MNNDQSARATPLAGYTSWKDTLWINMYDKSELPDLVTTTTLPASRETKIAVWIDAACILWLLLSKLH